MTTRICSKCSADKPLTEYYAHPRGRGGYQPKCKECCKFDAKTRAKLNPEIVRAYERKRCVDPARKAKVADYQRARRRRHPLKAKARNAVSNALRDGRLAKKPCEVCRDPKSQAHHNDYRYPLAVRWLCFKHHRQLAHSQNV